jgi:hypothetical protein
LRARTHPAGLGRDRPMPVASRSGSGRPPGRLRRFATRHGWRAWAIPILTVATFVCVLDITKDDQDAVAGSGDRAAPAGAADRAASPGQGGGRSRIYVDAPPAGDSSGDLNAALPLSALPPGAPYSTQGSGRFDVVPGWSRLYGQGGPLERYTVEIEAGVTVDRAAFAKAVEKTLGDPHSWGGGGRMTFQRVDSGPVEFRVSLAVPMTVRRLCGYTLPFETSCYNGDLGRAVINDARWVRGAVAYGSDLPAYRLYVINHEVGHALGHGHEPCPKAGALAPVMLQQTLGLDTAGVGRCRRNPWPYP